MAGDAAGVALKKAGSKAVSKIVGAVGERAGAVAAKKAGAKAAQKTLASSAAAGVVGAGADAIPEGKIASAVGGENVYDLLKRKGIPSTLSDEEIAAAKAVDLRIQVGKKSISGDVGKSSVSSNKVYFGQQAVSPNFSPQGTFKGASIQSVADRLVSGELSADNLPIEYIVRDGKMITMNNRSLTALSKANMKPTVLHDITSDVENEEKLTQRLSEMGGQPSESIFIRKIGEIVHIPN